jgi:hypothetical protein
VILGDFNSDLSIVNNNTLIETMMMFNLKLVNIISKTTRITDHSNTLLDPIIISDPINCIYSDVLKESSEISNHDASGFFTSVTCSFKWEDWLYDEVNKQIFIEKLETVDWITLLCHLRM